MPSNGFQLAQSLIQMEKHPLVVFVTKRHEYAVQGYGIAFRYLVKPLDQTLFAAAMDAEKVNGVWEQRLRIHYNCVGTIEIPSALPLPTPDVSVNTRKGVVVNYAPCDVAI